MTPPNMDRFIPNQHNFWGSLGSYGVHCFIFDRYLLWVNAQAKTFSPSNVWNNWELKPRTLERQACCGNLQTLSQGSKWEMPRKNMENQNPWKQNLMERGHTRTISQDCKGRSPLRPSWQHRNASQGVLDTYCARSMSCVQHHGPGPPGVSANAELGCRELRADDPRKTISIHSLCFTRVTERSQ